MVHPINVGIVVGVLYAFILRSAKLTDLERDGRYALQPPSDHSMASSVRQINEGGYDRQYAAENIRGRNRGNCLTSTVRGKMGITPT